MTAEFPQCLLREFFQVEQDDFDQGGITWLHKEIERIYEERVLYVQLG